MLSCDWLHVLVKVIRVYLGNILFVLYLFGLDWFVDIICGVWDSYHMLIHHQYEKGQS